MLISIPGPFPDLALLRAGWQCPATTENTFSISPAHLHGQSPPRLTAPFLHFGEFQAGKKHLTHHLSLAEVTSTTCSDTQGDASAGGVSPEHSLGLGLPL